jgi:hypothetical protein
VKRMGPVSSIVGEYYEYSSISIFFKWFVDDERLSTNVDMLNSRVDIVLFSDAMLEIATSPPSAKHDLAGELASIYAARPDETLGFLSEFRALIKRNPLKKFLIEIYSSPTRQISFGPTKRMEIADAQSQDVARAFNLKHPEEKPVSPSNVRTTLKRLRDELAAIEKFKADDQKWKAASRAKDAATLLKIVREAWSLESEPHEKVDPPTS